MGFFDDFARNIGHFFDLSPERQEEANRNNAKWLKDKQSADGYRAPVGASGSVIGDLLSGRRANDIPASPVSPADTSWITSANNAPEYDFNFDGNDSGYNDFMDHKAKTDPLWESLKENFDFNGARGGVDTSAFDEALKARMDLIAQAKSNANSNFATSDANLKGMHEAVVNDTRAQAPTIKAQYDQAGNDISKIFGNTINENNTEQSQLLKTKEEMLQRLGIAPAANQPDIVGQEFAKANSAAQNSRDTRLAENTSMGQTAQDRNNNFANSVNAEGVARRSTLNQQLQDILGNLDKSGADYQNDALTQKMNYQDKRVDQSYDNWLQNRGFDFNLLQEENANNRGIAADNAKIQLEREKANSDGNSVQGFDGLWGQTPPAVKQAIMAVQSKVNIDREPDKAWRLIQDMADKDPSINKDEAYQYLQKRATLGTTNKFPVQ